MQGELALEFARVTEAAAIAASEWIGKGRKKSADRAATEAMRTRFNSIRIKGKVVIGEGEKDEAPMLYIGEKVGSGEGPETDIAVDPIEGTNSVAYGYPNSISVFAAGPKGTLLHAPDTYMNKISVCPQASDSGVHLDNTTKDNIERVAKACGKNTKEVTAVVLERPRHEKLIKEIREAGARVRLISDGDVAGAMAPCLPESGIDILMGTGGAPEGVISAAAIKCFGGFFQGRLAPKNEEHAERARKMGVDPEKLLEMEDLAKGNDLMFAATGIVDGPVLRGVTSSGFGSLETHSLVMRTKTRTVRFIEAHHHLKQKPNFS